jgi:hypothetical protein
VTETDEITLRLPGDRDFHRVAHLVLGGLAVRLDLTIETLEDLQLALSAILDRVTNGEVTVRMLLSGGTLETRVAPVDLGDELTRDGDEPDELSLRRVLWTIVDEVELEGDSVLLTKRVADG